MKSRVNDRGALIKPGYRNDCRKTESTVRQMPKAGLLADAVPMADFSWLHRCPPYTMTDQNCGQNEVKWKSEAYSQRMYRKQYAPLLS